MNGKPSAHNFRPLKPDPAKLPPGAPPLNGRAPGELMRRPDSFITDTLGRHWPVREGVPVSDLRQANPPLTQPALRLALTENDHPGARTTRTDVRSYS